MNPKDFKRKRALGFAPHIYMNLTHYIGVFMFVDKGKKLIRSFGGTANEDASEANPDMTPERQSLIWARDKGFTFSPEAMDKKHYKALHKLEIIGAPLMPNRPDLDLKPINHYETHGIFAGDPSLAAAHPGMPLLYMQDDRVVCTEPDVEWSNEGLKHIFGDHMLPQATLHGYKYNAMKVLKERFTKNPFAGTPQPL